jgi:hypothetical protein
VEAPVDSPSRSGPEVLRCKCEAHGGRQYSGGKRTMISSGYLSTGLAWVSRRAIRKFVGDTKGLRPAQTFLPTRELKAKLHKFVLARMNQMSDRRVKPL